MPLKYLCEWELHHLFEKPVPMTDHSSKKKFLLMSSLNFAHPYIGPDAGSPSSQQGWRLENAGPTAL